MNIQISDNHNRFQTIASSLTIPAQAISKPIILQTIDDNIYQGTQIVNLTVSSVDPSITADPNNLTITLNDNDAAPEITIGNTSSNENNSPLRFSATLNRASIYPTEFDYVTQNVTALSGSDYYATTNGHLIIPAGQISGEIQIDLINDNVSELNETFNVMLSNPIYSSLITATAVGTIVNDDNVPQVTFAVSSQSINENIGSLQIQISLDSVSAQTISIPYIMSGTATGADYTLGSSSSITIPAGQSTATINLSVIDDTLNEANENLIFSLDTPTNASLGANTTHTLTITDNDSTPTVQLSAGSQSLREDADTASVNLVLSAVSGQDITVPIILTGTATGFSDDYILATSTPVVIPAGSTSIPINFTLINDLVTEPDETIIVTLGAPTNANLGAITVHTITLSDSIYITINNVTVLENAGTATFTISLNKTSSSNVTVNWEAAAGTAIAGTNYTTGSGTATILAGSTSTTISIPIIDTAEICEGDRVFFVNLNSPTNAAIQDNQGSGTIQENDFPTVSVGNVTSIEGSIASVPVMLSQSCNVNISFSYSMTDGSAVNNDYIGMSSTFTIEANRTNKLLGVVLLEDSLVESSENFTLSIFNPINAALGATTSTITITDNDVTLTSASDIAFVSAGSRHTCAIRAGAAYCWGTNGNGELGNGNTNPSFTQVAVIGLSSGVTKIASSGIGYTSYITNERSCAIVSGAAKCWGYQSYGELGNGGGPSSSTPVDVVGLSSGVTDIDTSDIGYGGFTCAVHNGAAKCWGNNSDGQIGDGTTTTRFAPTIVSGLGTGVVSISVGDTHACAALSDGTVKCWGRNSVGQLGDGTTTNSLVPVAVSGISSGATKVALGYRHSCAIVTGGVKCWGNNSTGQLGNGTTTTSLVPVDAIGLTSGVQDLSASGDSIGGYQTTCAIDSAGAVKCWGTNAYYQLGDGTTTNRSVPTQVSGLTAGFIQVSTSTLTSCAVSSTGKLYCWGNYTSGQAGNSSAAIRYSPVEPIGLTSQVSSISVGYSNGCAIQNGVAKCWGANSNGQLGTGNTTHQFSPITVTGLTSGVTSIAMDNNTYNGNRHTCAVVNGAAKCWGDNNSGQLGNGTTGGSISTPVQVSGLTSGVLSVSVSEQHSCAVMIAGGIKCWGYNHKGQLGNNSTSASNVPVDVIGINSATEVSAAYGHTCAIDGGAMKCWGFNNYGQLGNGTSTDSLTPIIPNGLAAGVTSITTQDYNSTGSSCAVVNGSAKCWGYGYIGNLGTGNGSNQNTPTQVVGFTSNVKKIVSAGYRSCLLTNDGAVYCWGNNNTYHVIAPSLSVAMSSLPIANTYITSGAIDISIGNAGVCIITNANSLKCWGNYTMLGINITSAHIPTPVEVLFP